jgi:putative ABC transport system permease protein
MLINYLKIAFRKLLQNKLLSAINILGLAMGFASCILISIYVFHETSYDRFHENADRIVRATMEMSASGKVTHVAVTGTKVLPEFKRIFPEVETGVRTYPVSTVVTVADQTFREKRFVYADSSFFGVFSFRLLKGDPQTVLTNPYQLVVTASTAKKYFGETDAIGKTLRINNEKDYVITGITEDCPENSQIKFDILASWSSLTDPVYTTESWFDASHYTYLLLRNREMVKPLEARIQAHFKELSAKDDPSGRNYLTIHIQPLRDVHLRAMTDGGFEPGGDYRYVYIFSIIAIFILGIACANYINLTTANASGRAKEVGMRKAVGASRTKLLVQFTSESMIIVFVALVTGVLLANLLLPAFNEIASKQLSLGILLTPIPSLILLATLLSVGFLGSLYPSIVLSHFKPVDTLKGKFNTSASGTGLRKSLIVLQFVISVALIVSTLVVNDQLAFIQGKNLGYDKDRVVVLQGDVTLRDKMELIKTELQRNPEVVAVTTCNQTPVFVPGKYNLSLDGDDMLVTAIRVDRDFIKTMGLTIQHGTDFTEQDQSAAFSDTDTIQRPVILNEKAVRSFGWTPGDAVGKTLTFQGRNSIVKAVVSDFHFSSMHEPIGPIVIFLSNRASKILVKITGADIPQTLRFMKEKWATLAPHLTFDYEFLDDQFNTLYAAETRAGKLLYRFALLGILLASLGLLGLIMFTVRQRKKEIGIRKVLGASIASIVQLLSVELLRPVCTALLIAFPIAWWLMQLWLQGFAYHTTIGWETFAAAGILSGAIAFFALTFHALKAATANPVDALRNE